MGSFKPLGRSGKFSLSRRSHRTSFPRDGDSRDVTGFPRTQYVLGSEVGPNALIYIIVFRGSFDANVLSKVSLVDHK